MEPTSECLDGLITAVLNDNQTFGGTSYELRIGQTTITPGDMTNWQDANFPGYGAITSNQGFDDGIDPLLNRRALTLLPPAGGFRNVVSGANGPINQTLRSWSIFNLTNNQTIASGNLPEQIPVTQNGQQINYPPPQVTIDQV